MSAGIVNLGFDLSDSDVFIGQGSIRALSLSSSSLWTFIPSWGDFASTAIGWAFNSLSYTYIVAGFSGAVAGDAVIVSALLTELLSCKKHVWRSHQCKADTGLTPRGLEGRGGYFPYIHDQSFWASLFTGRNKSIEIDHRKANRLIDITRKWSILVDWLVNLIDRNW